MTVTVFMRAVQVAMTVLAAAVLVHQSASSISNRAPGVVTEPDGSDIVALGEDAGGRWIRHRAGTTRVPLHPTRVCALNFADELVSLGLTPSAVATDWREQKLDYLRDDLAGAAPIPHSLGQWLPSFEAIAAHGPDLILTWAADRHTFEQLSRIAPTVVVRTLREVLDENGSIASLEQRLRDIALVVGREAAALAAISKFREHLTASRELLGDTMDGRTIAFVRARGRQWRLYGKHDECGGEAIYAGLGLEAPALVRDRGTELDPERLLAFDADFLVVVADPMLASDEALQRLQTHPLWNRIRAVNTGHVHRVEALEHWILSGLLGKARMIDDAVSCALAPCGRSTSE
ncbi:MAG: ABC transporter substrate-binding protein [Planctomycetaceae bacterium]|nr:ABC transporter substrate-binding protein [Planctomycetaceae bacterium]